MKRMQETERVGFPRAVSGESTVIGIIITIIIRFLDEREVGGGRLCGC